MVSLAERVQEAKGRLGELRMVVLPDFFLDHFIALDTFAPFQRQATGIHDRGGGNLLTGPQSFRVGGNAANTAYALGRLGLPTTLITQTDRFGASVLDDAFKGLPVDTSCIQIGARTSATAALEFKDANVMLSDPGPLARFGPDDLEAIPRAWPAIERADAVALTNWSQTLDHGTHLLETVMMRAQRAGAFTFLDTGDPTHRGAAARELLDGGRPLEHVSAWGMNENELRFFAALAKNEGQRETTDRPHDDPQAELEAAALALRSAYPGRLDVHTGTSVFSLGHNGPVGCGTFLVEPLRLTGSGDAWNAGNLLGEMLGEVTEERLCLANAVAALTITAADGLPPTLDQLIDFLHKRPFESRVSLF